MRIRSVVAAGCLTAGLAFGVAACGSDDNGGGGGGGSTGSTNLTIYSSLPLQGDNRVQSQSVVNGEKMALQEHGGKIGKFTIKYVSLDDSTAATGKWEPGAVSTDARKAAQDKSTIAYLGEFNSGASAISIPILNDVGILQVSPSNTAVGLTQDAPGADKGEPDKYYPTGKRNYGRVVPTDTIQAAAQVSYQKDAGCTKLYILNDKEVYGKGLADVVQQDATAAGLQVLGNDGIDTKAANFRSLATKVKSKGADCMFFGGIVENKGVQLWKDMYAANPDMKLFGPDGVALSAFSENIGASEKNTYITNPTLDPKLYPPSGQEFFANYRKKYGKDPEPYAIYGYEAMQDALLAIQNAGDKGNDRQAVVDQFFQIKDRDSVLGKYSIDKNGDTTLSDYGGNRVKNGKLVFDKVIKAQT